VHFFAPGGATENSPQFQLWDCCPKNSKPRRGGGKIAADDPAVPAGLDAVFAQNPELKLRAIFKRRFAAGRAAGMDAVDVRELR